jgi:hypothetical protein
MSVSRRVTQAPRSRSKRRRQSRALRGGKRGGSSGHESQSKSKKNGLKYAAMGAGVVATGVVMHNRWNQHRQGNLSRPTSSNLTNNPSGAPFTSALSIGNTGVSTRLTDEDARALINEVETELHAINLCSEDSKNIIKEIKQKLSTFEKNYEFDNFGRKRVWTLDTNDILIKYNYVQKYETALKNFFKHQKSVHKKSEWDLVPANVLKIETTREYTLENAKEFIKALKNATTNVTEDAAIRYSLEKKDLKNLREIAEGICNIRNSARYLLPGKVEPDWYRPLNIAKTNASLVKLATLTSCDETIAKSIIKSVVKADELLDPSLDLTANDIKQEIEQQQQSDEEQMRKNIDGLQKQMQSNANTKTDYHEMLLNNIQLDYISADLSGEIDELLHSDE